MTVLVITAQTGLPVPAYESVWGEDFRRSATAHMTSVATDLLSRPLRTPAEHAAAPAT